MIKKAQHLKPGDVVFGFPVGHLKVTKVTPAHRDGKRVGVHVHWRLERTGEKIQRLMMRTNREVEVEEWHVPD